MGHPAAVGSERTSPTCGSTRSFNYCTAIGYATDRARFDRYWPADYHIIGKDILRFHAVYWPAMLLAAGEAPPKRVFAHGFLLVGGEKMSKTALNQIAPTDLRREFGADGFRYHFLADQRFGPDGDFSYEAMVARYNADLANNFGNLASRVLNMAASYCDGIAPSARADGPLVAASARAFDEATRHMEQLDYSAAYVAVWELIRAANSYIEDQEPWKLHKAGDADARRGGARRLPRDPAPRRAPRVSGDPARRAASSGDASASTVHRRISAFPTPPPGASDPRAPASAKGDALFPRIDIG